VTVPGDRHDVRVVQVVPCPQDPLGLLQQPVVIGVAFGEQQLAPDHGGPRLDVQVVGRAVQPTALAMDAGVEDVPTTILMLR